MIPIPIYQPSLQSRNVPVKLVSITACQPFNEISAAGEINCPPPLLTKKSNLPCLANVWDTKFLSYKDNDENVGTGN